MTSKMEIARTLADHLFATEEAIDAAIASAAGLAGYMPVARKGVRAAADVGQPAFEQVIATMTMLGQARRQIVEAHQSIAESGQRVNVPAVNFGGFVSKPSHERAELKAIREDRAA